MKSIISSTYRLYQLLCFFVVYSFIGWCIETFATSLASGHFENRGFLNGPFLPIYGFGALILIIAYERFQNREMIFFWSAIILTTSLELAVGLIMKALFNRMWWDYSNEPYNIMGLICLKASILWGFYGLFFIRFIHPHIVRLVSLIPGSYRKTLCCAVLLIFTIDLAASLFEIRGISIDVIQLIQLPHNIITSLGIGK